MNYFTQAVAALLASSVLVACGGGDFDAAAIAAVLPAPASAAEAPTHVRIEGCVADANGRPLALAVFASGADGQLLASALSQTDGVFRMHVPAQQVVRFAAATPGAEPLTLLTGTGATTVTGCLRAAV